MDAIGSVRRVGIAMVVDQGLRGRGLVQDLERGRQIIRNTILVLGHFR